MENERLISVNRTAQLAANKMNASDAIELRVFWLFLRSTKKVRPNLGNLLKSISLQKFLDPPLKTALSNQT